MRIIVMIIVQQCDIIDNTSTDGRSSTWAYLSAALS